MSRGKQIFVRMTSDDYELVQAEAARTGKSGAAVLRDAFLGTRKSLGFAVITYSPRSRPYIGEMLGSLDEAAKRRDDPDRVSMATRQGWRDVVAEVFEVEEAGPSATGAAERALAGLEDKDHG